MFVLHGGCTVSHQCDLMDLVGKMGKSVTHTQDNRTTDAQFFIFLRPQTHTASSKQGISPST